MRMPSFVFLLLTGLSAADEPTLPAEMTRMIETLDNARSIRVDVESRVAGIASWSTSVRAAKPNKLHVRMAVSAVESGQTQELEFVSDGKLLTTIRSGIAAKTAPAHAQLQNRLQQSLSRTGFLFTYLQPVAPDGQDQHDLAQLVEIQKCETSGPAESEGRILHVLDYQFRVPTLAEPVTCRVWVDGRTHLPTRRTFTIGNKTVTETYQNWNLNQLIPESQFEIRPSGLSEAQKN